MLTKIIHATVAALAIGTAAQAAASTEMPASAAPRPAFNTAGMTGLVPLPRPRPQVPERADDLPQRS